MSAVITMNASVLANAKIRIGTDSHGRQNIFLTLYGEGLDGGGVELDTYLIDPGLAEGVGNALLDAAVDKYMQG